MSFSALDSELLGGLFTTAEMSALFSDEIRIAAMLRVEIGLARSQVALGLAPPALAEALDRIGAGDFDLAHLGRGTALAGVPVIPFVNSLRALLPKDLEPFLHRGATTQDVADTALVLIIRDALRLIALDLDAVIAGLITLAERHRATPCVGRSYGQQAAPISFGFRVAVWLAGIAEVADDLPRIRDQILVVSYGGPVGALGALGEKGPAALAAFARELELRAPPIAWHTRRYPVATLGAWLAHLLGGLAKMATDVVFLAATEIGEVAEPHIPGRGGSSAMPHKRNPVSSAVILAAAQAAVGLSGTLTASMAAGQERPAGAWHAEWHALPQLFGLTAGALAEARRLVEGLTVDPERMAGNLNLTQGLIFADAAAALLTSMMGRGPAHELVESAAGVARERGGTLTEAIMAHPDRPAELTADTLDAAFDFAPSVAAAAAWVTPVLSMAAETRARLAQALQE